MKEENFIPLIHNYCDRWCERCRFIMRCRVGVEEVERLNQGKTDPEDMYQIVADNLRKALEMLEKYAKDNGIDWDKLQGEIDDVEIPEPTYTMEQDQLKEWGKEYIILGRDWFEHNELIIKSKEDELNHKVQIGIEGTTKQAAQLVNAMEVIRWFLFFISVKMDRAIHGMQSDLFDMDDLDPVQNDFNGSAKVALDAIERSLAAWEVVRENFPDTVDELIDIFVLLGRMRKGMHRVFPLVNDFVRPGFDEPDLYAVE